MKVGESPKLSTRKICRSQQLGLIISNLTCVQNDHQYLHRSVRYSLNRAFTGSLQAAIFLIKVPPYGRSISIMHSPLIGHFRS